MKLTDDIYYDSIQAIYFLKKDQMKPKAFFDTLEYSEVKTWEDLIKHIEEKENDKIEMITIIAELGLSGIVIRWNEYEGIFQVGTTRGYA